MKSRPITLLLALVLLAFGGSAAATSFVMVSDESLVDRSALIVDARVLSSDAAPRDGMPSTDYMIEVDRALSGHLTGRNLIVRVPGGVGHNGYGLAVFGMPEFTVGERVLLFLTPRADGTYGIVHLMLGAFHEVVVDGKPLLLRDLSGARELALPGEAAGSRAEYRQPRHAAPFRRWIEDRARGEEREADYRVTAEADGEAGGLSSVTGEYVLFTSGTGRNMRWFTFDEDRDVDWRILTGGQPGYGQSLTAQIAQAAMNAWNTVSQTNIRYRYAGTTTSTQGFDGCGQEVCVDQINSIIFGNADGSHDTPFTCVAGEGGVLAIGGPWFRSMPVPGPNGASYHPISEAEISTNQGIECFLTSFADLLQLLAHELGHTLGINHTCNPDTGSCTALQSDALMYPFFHDDERGAALNSDDRSAVRYLYPGSTGAAPGAPHSLTATALSAFEVELNWTDNSDNETFFRIEGRPSGVGSFANMGTATANEETFVVADGLDPLTAYDFRVQARNGSAGSPYSNTVTVSTLADVPEPPANLSAAVTTGETVFLQWDDLADNEDSFVVEARTPSTDGWQVVEDAIAADSTSFFVGGLTSGQPYTFRVRAVNDKGSSPPSEEVPVTPLPVAASTCVADAETLCLLGDRFEVFTHWRTEGGDFGTGQGEEFSGSDLTGRFTFFNPNNVELIVKVLDGGILNDHFWTFYGALSDVEYWITVVDTAEGDSRTYYNPPKGSCGEFDKQSFAQDQGAALRAQPLNVDVLPGGPAARTATAPLEVVTAAQGTCEADAETLCLLDDRFAVKVHWINQHNGGEEGDGTAIADPNGDRTGYFWFFNPANVELVTKALYFPPTDTHWFFYGALSDVEYRIDVTDTETGESKSYFNPPFGECGQFDTGAFPPLDDELPEDPIVGSSLF